LQIDYQDKNIYKMANIDAYKFGPYTTAWMEHKKHIEARVLANEKTFASLQNPRSSSYDKLRNETMHMREELQVMAQQVFEIKGRGAQGLALCISKSAIERSHYIKVLMEFWDNKLCLFKSRENIQRVLYKKVTKSLFAKHFAKRVTQFMKVYKVVLFAQSKKKYFKIAPLKAASEPRDFKDDNPDSGSTSILKQGMADLVDRVEQIEFFGQQTFKKYDTAITGVKIELAKFKKMSNDLTDQIPLLKEVFLKLNSYSVDLTSRINIQDNELKDFKVECLNLRSEFKVQKLLLEGRIKERDLADKEFNLQHERLKKIKNQIDQQEVVHQKRLTEQDEAYNNLMKFHKKIIKEYDQKERDNRLEIDNKLNQRIIEEQSKMRLENRVDTRIYVKELFEANMVKQKETLSFAQGKIIDTVESNLMKRTIDCDLLLSEMKGELGQMKRARNDAMKMKPTIYQITPQRQNNPIEVAEKVINMERLRSVAGKVLSESQYWDHAMTNSIYAGERANWETKEFLSARQAMPYDERMNQDQWSWQRNINQSLNSRKFFESLI